MMYLVQLTGLGGLALALYGRHPHQRSSGGIVGLVALVVSLVNWGAW